MTSPPPFCLSSVEVKTSAAHSYYLVIFPYPLCHREILININTFQKLKIFILNSVNSASTVNHFASCRYTVCSFNANFSQKCHQVFHDRVDMCIVFDTF